MNKAPLQVDDKTQKWITLSSRLASAAGVIPEKTMEYLLQNEHHVEILDLVRKAAMIGLHQILALKTVTDLPTMPIPSELAKHWEGRWQTIYGIKSDFSGLIVPKPPTHFKARLVVMHEKGSNSPELLYRANEKLMTGACRHWKFCGDQSLDEAVPKHNFTGTFGCWVADDDEAPFGNLGGINLSARAVRELGSQFGLRTTTLPVRLVLGADVFLENDSKKILDRQVVTMCAESETAGGAVPGVDFRAGGGKVYVDDWRLDDADVGVRFRPAVYLPF